MNQLINDAPLPAIIHWDQYHFVVLTPQSSKNNLLIADPAKGLIKLKEGRISLNAGFLQPKMKQERE
ncbi:MAG: cysteine peptidase family C39 domain-containing protein [Segetibacter sp.]